MACEAGRLARILKQTAGERKVFEAPKYVRSSQIFNMCIWEEYFKDKHFQVPEAKYVEMTRELDFTFTLGTFIHEYLQSVVIGPLGFLKGEWVCVTCHHSHKDCYYPDACVECDGGTFHYEEYTLYDKELKLSGHVDGLICNNRMNSVFHALEAGARGDEVKASDDLEEDLKHLEIKSANEWSFKSVISNRQPPEYNRVQACAYQHMTGMEETVFLYVNMNTKKMMTLSYKAEPELWDKAVDKIHTLWEAIDAGTPPPPSMRECLSLKDKRACKCPFAFECFGTR